MQKFLKSTRYKGVVVNSSIAIATIPSKYLKVFTNTMEMKRIANVPKSGIYDKRPITVIFSITLDGKFLSMHQIYKGKNTLTLLKVKLPEDFSLSVNEKPQHNEKRVNGENCLALYQKNKRQELW